MLVLNVHVQYITIRPFAAHHANLEFLCITSIAMHSSCCHKIFVYNYFPFCPSPCFYEIFVYNYSPCCSSPCNYGIFVFGYLPCYRSPMLLWNFCVQLFALLLLTMLLWNFRVQIFSCPYNMQSVAGLLYFYLQYYVEILVLLAFSSFELVSASQRHSLIGFISYWLNDWLQFIGFDWFATSLVVLMGICFPDLSCLKEYNTCPLFRLI